MSLNKKTKTILDHHIGCFGEFNLQDRICRACCALRIRCAVESDMATKMELIEELFFAETTNVTMQ
jgi:hypothetical protein